MLLDVLIGLNIAALLWNLFYMACITVENRELKRKQGEQE